MTKNDVKTVANRNFKMHSLPDVLGTCDRYDITPALRTTDTWFLYESPRATLEHLLEDASVESLKSLVTPVLVAWAQHWHAVGMPPVQLAEMLEFAVSMNQEDDSYRLLVRQLLNAEIPAYQEPEPARCVVEVSRMPTVVGVGGRSGVGNRRQLLIRHPDSRQESCSLSHGFEGLLVKQLDGSALLMFHHDGYVRQEDVFPSALRVPADLVLTVNDVLSDADCPFHLAPAEAMAADD